MLDRGRVFIRNFSGIFERRDGERSPCPRCEGSGLFHRPKLWSWNCTAYPNNPCWFCEGVGVMPLYGLHGFFRGRASAAFRTKDLKKPLDSPIRLQLCSGKFPGTRCKLKSFKPSEGVQDFLYNWSKTPSWLIDAAAELGAMTALGNSGDNDLVSKLSDGSEISQSVTLQSPMISPLDPSKLAYHFDHDISSESSMNVDNISLSRGLAQSDISNWKNPVERRQKGITKGSVKDGKVPVPLQVSAPTSRLRSNKSLVPKQTEAEEVKDLRKRWSNSKRTRLARRNHIRSKAKRESIERALRIEPLKPLRVEHSTSATPSDQSGPVWSFSGSWKELSSNWLAEETARARQLARSAQSEAAGAPNLPPGKQVLYARLVDMLPFIPNFVKLPKW